MTEETIASEVLAASIGGAISAAILYPLEVLKTKMQAVSNDDNDTERQADQSMIRFARQLYEREGYMVFLKGIEISAFQSALEKALYFFTYTALKAAHHSLTGSTKLGTGSNLVLGCIAEWAHLPITLPVDTLTTKIKTSNAAPTAILLAMLSRDNKKDWYKGITAYYLLCFKPALQYTVYEQVKQFVLFTRQSKILTAGEAFVLGMIARTVSTVIVFPILRAKVLMQTSKCDVNDNSSALSTMDILCQQWNQSGLSGLYYGIVPELSRGIMSSALMLMIKEKIAQIVRQFLSRPRVTKLPLRL